MVVILIIFFILQLIFICYSAMIAEVSASKAVSKGDSAELATFILSGACAFCVTFTAGLTGAAILEVW